MSAGARTGPGGAGSGTGHEPASDPMREESTSVCTGGVKPTHRSVEPDGERDLDAPLLGEVPAHCTQLWSVMGWNQVDARANTMIASSAGTNIPSGSGTSRRCDISSLVNPDARPKSDEYSWPPTR